MKLRRWFLPETPDVLGMLAAQASVTLEGMVALEAWARGDPAQAERVRALEHQADDRKRELLAALRRAFTTPIDAEDLYTLSQNVDAVLNEAKDAVRESEVMRCPPDAALADMAALLVEGVRALETAIERLGAETGEATDAADAAVKSQRRLERVYRAAMAELIDQADLREVTARRELYRRFSRMGDTVIAASERVWYAVVKEG